MIFYWITFFFITEEKLDCRKKSGNQFQRLFIPRWIVYLFHYIQQKYTYLREFHQKVKKKQENSVKHSVALNFYLLFIKFQQQSYNL